MVVNDNAKKPVPKIRRNSTGNLDFNTSSTTPPQPLPLPNYLRASMGSCHDFCKYGGLKPKPEEFTPIRTATATSKKPPILPTKTTPLHKKPPVLPAKTSKLARSKSQNVTNVVKNSTSSNATNQLKKPVIPKHPNGLKLKPLAKNGVLSSSSSVIIPILSPSRRRYSDVYGSPHAHSIKNGRSGHKAVCVTPIAAAAATASQAVKRGVSRNASKRDLSQCGNKSTNKAEIEPCCEIPVEKILYIDEVLTPCKEAYEHSSIQKLSSEDDGFSSTLSEDNTTGSTCSDTLASVSITSCDSDSDISSNMYTPKKGDCETDSDISSNTFKSNKGDVSILVTSCETHSDISSNKFHTNKFISVDDCIKSTETRNEPIQVVVLLHRQQNQEEETSVSDNKDALKEATRLLVEAGKVKALVSAFEAVIYLEDDMSLRTLKA